MKEPSWTPGPWSIRHSHDASGDIGITHPGGKNVLAECFADIRHDKEQSPEVLANARLIASAPDLYAALAELTESYRPLSRPTGAPGSPARLQQEHEAEVYKRARAALAKARGEQP